jgi:Fic family protein
MRIGRLGAETAPGPTCALSAVGSQSIGYISLERIFEESKKSYYETLEASSKRWHDGKHDAFPWLDYFWGVLIRAYREFEERIGKIKTGSKGWKTVQVRQAVERRVGAFAISEIEADCRGISRDMVRLVLRQMKKEGLIRAVGAGRASKWTKST